MRIAVFSAKPFEREALTAANARHRHELVFIEAVLGVDTTRLAAGCEGACLFVTDHATGDVLASLVGGGTRLLTLRSAGFDHVDLAAAAALGIVVARVPAYSPHAIAEHAVGLVLSLNRKVHRAWARVREGNLALDGLIGFDLRGKTVGVIGTGNIGAALCRIMLGFGCRVVAHDIAPREEVRSLGVVYRPLDDVLGCADVLSLHVPLQPETRHLIDAAAIARLKSGVILINTSRGAVVDTSAVIDGVKSGQIGAVGLDVYEGEADLFFRDWSGRVIQDDVFARLLTFPNVLVTPHQAFLTREAVANIAETALANATAFATGVGELHVVT